MDHPSPSSTDYGQRIRAPMLFSGLTNPIQMSKNQRTPLPARPVFTDSTIAHNITHVNNDYTNNCSTWNIGFLKERGHSAPFNCSAVTNPRARPKKILRNELRCTG
jgi:hypothetical protein